MSLLRICRHRVWYCATNTRRNCVPEKIQVVTIFNQVPGSLPVACWKLSAGELSPIFLSTCVPYIFEAVAVVRWLLACHEWCAALNPRCNRVPRQTRLSPTLNVLWLLLAQWKLRLSNGRTIHTFYDQSSHSKCCCQPETPICGTCFRRRQNARGVSGWQQHLLWGLWS